MRKLIPGSLLFIFSGLVLFLLSCSPEQCSEETESLIKASLYDMETGKPLAPDSLTLYGLDMDTVKIYDKTAKLLTALIPLNAAVNNCIFIIRINGITDTLDLQYTGYPQLLSKECGYTYFFNLDTTAYTTNAIDSISVIKLNITTHNEENIRIFY